MLIFLNDVDIRSMDILDYDLVIELWRSTDGIGLSEADSMTGINSFLRRNPGFSLVAQKGSEIVGAVLCGHDGRRGYLHHLAVRTDFRFQGLGKELVSICLQKLKDEGIDKCHLFVFEENREASKFWTKIGWQIRSDLNLMSKK